MNKKLRNNHYSLFLSLVLGALAVGCSSNTFFGNVVDIDQGCKVPNCSVREFSGFSDQRISSGRSQPVTINGSDSFPIRNQQAEGGDAHTCWISGKFSAVSRPEVFCIGKNNLGQLGVDPQRTMQPGNLNYSSVWIKSEIGNMGLGEFHSIASGGNTTCVITGVDRSVYCWGGNQEGQLGNDLVVGSGTNRRVAVFSWRLRPFLDSNLRQITGVEKVSVGPSNVCVIAKSALSDDRIYCSGRQDLGAIGEINGSATVRRVEGGTPMPFRIDNDKITALHQLVGVPAYRVLPFARNVDLSEFKNSNSSYSQIIDLSVGNDFVCGVFYDPADGGKSRTVCWGVNDQSQTRRVLEPPYDRCGLTTNNPPSTIPCSGEPSVIEERIGPGYQPASDAVAVYSGASHSCIIAANGVSFGKRNTVRCWGANDRKQIGLDFTYPVGYLTLYVQGLLSVTSALGVYHDVIQLHLGDQFTCSLSDTVSPNEKLRCFGLRGESKMSGSWVLPGVGERDHYANVVDSRFDDGRNNQSVTAGVRMITGGSHHMLELITMPRFRQDNTDLFMIMGWRRNNYSQAGGSSFGNWISNPFKMYERR